jgi:hypothetical protein
MSNHKMAAGLVQTWVPVVDTDGRTRLEAHWVDPSTPTHVIHAA